MTKEKKDSIYDQLAVKRALIKEFDLVEKKVGQAWLDSIDLDPDPENPNHWDFLLYNKKKNFYVNLKFFPRITIEPTHTNSYNIGIINYTDKTKIKGILEYFHNILDEE